LSIAVVTDSKTHKKDFTDKSDPTMDLALACIEDTASKLKRQKDEMQERWSCVH
jgi:hypothetical protein